MTSSSIEQEDLIPTLANALSRIRAAIAGDKFKWQSNTWLEAKTIVDRYREEAGSRGLK